MKILLDGYFDHNLGDDLMLTIAAGDLKEHELYIPSRKVNIENAQYTEAKNGFDMYLRVTGSGFLLYNTLGVAYHLRDIYREKKYAPKSAVIGCNIGPFGNRIGEAIIRNHLGRFDFVTVRDEWSLEYMNKYFPKKNTLCRPDMVFSLPDDMIPDVQSENILGIAVRGTADCESLAHIADGYIAETGGKVAVMCFDTGLENDILAAELVYEKSRAKDKIEIVKYERIDDMLCAIKRCSVMLCVRLHSSILSARMGVPFVPVPYSDKTVNALSKAGFEGKSYRSGNLPEQEVLSALLNPQQFKLSTDVMSAASEHVGKFKEYLASVQS